MYLSTNYNLLQRLAQVGTSFHDQSWTVTEKVSRRFSPLWQLLQYSRYIVRSRQLSCLPPCQYPYRKNFANKGLWKRYTFGTTTIVLSPLPEIGLFKISSLMSSLWFATGSLGCILMPAVAFLARSSDSQFPWMFLRTGTYTRFTFIYYVLLLRLRGSNWKILALSMKIVMSLHMSGFTHINSHTSAWL